MFLIINFLLENDLGITLDIHNSQQFQFENIQKMVFDFLTLNTAKNFNNAADDEKSQVKRRKKEENLQTHQIAEYNKITISKKSEILTTSLKKIYKCVNNKGIIDISTSIVYPFGYK